MVDFGRIIGNYRFEDANNVTKSVPTSRGLIHYDAQGKIHVIPSQPTNFKK